MRRGTRALRASWMWWRLYRGLGGTARGVPRPVARGRPAPAGCGLSCPTASRWWPGNQGLDAPAGVVDPDHGRPERHVLDHRKRGRVDHDPLVTVQVETQRV